MDMPDLDKYHSFLKSAITPQGSFLNTNETFEWLKLQNDSVRVDVQKIPFNNLKMWHFDEAKGSLCHDSKHFFSIDGIRVRTNKGDIKEWDQPIINQPEIGYLGFIVKEFDGILHFLMQAKIEPGNTNFVQLSPTLQATKSNYTKVHKGKTPDYLEYFVSAKPSQILVDQLQSEQGARFLHKRNRNIIIKVAEDINLKDNFVWLTLGQIKSLMAFDNLINMDSRTVISCVPMWDLMHRNYNIGQFDFSAYGNPFFKSAFNLKDAYHSFDDILAFITRQKVDTELLVERIPLKGLQNWVVGENEITHLESRYFKIIATEVNISNREVISWTQPMVEPAQEGLCAFICKDINGLQHFAVQCKMECGNFDTIELAPTVQCLTGNYNNPTSIGNPAFLNYVLNALPEQIVFDTYQSEEGGRFFREQNRNMLIIANDDFSVHLPESYIWMTLAQLNLFVKFNNYVNIQARSLLSAISFLSTDLNG